MPPRFLRMLVVTATLSACSGPAAGDRERATTGGTAGSSSATNATSGTGGSSGAGGMPGEGGADTAGTDPGGSSSSVDPPPAAPSGEVVVGSLVFYPTPTQSQTLAYARFRSAPSASACQKTRYGDCSVAEACDDQPASVSPHAGLITVLSPEPSFSLELPPNAAGVYPQWSQSGAVFTGGESVSIAAAGGDVPAFSRELTYPLLLLVTEPSLPDGESVARAPRTADLSLRWERGSAGVQFQVQSQNTKASLVCSVPSELGALTIPSAALARLDPTAELLLLTFATEHVKAGDFDVSLLLAGVAVTPDKKRRVSIALQ